MQISRPNDATVLLTRLDAFLTGLLRRIAASADVSEHPAARQRLFSSPTEDAAESELVEDWKEYIAPELQQLFLSTIEVIERDLDTMQVDAKTGDHRLAIPSAHLESWIHGLNQARLALAARYGFGDNDIEEALPIAGDARSLALLQVRLYGILQELFLRELGGV